MRRDAHSLSESYEAEPGVVARARADIAGFAVTAGATDVQIDDIRLAVSEAVTNAVLHGYRGAAGQIELTAHVDARKLWVIVGDGGGGLLPQTDRPGLGLGLGLIAQITDHMTIVPRPAGGTELRMRFDLDSVGNGPVDVAQGSVGFESEMAAAVASPSPT